MDSEFGQKVKRNIYSVARHKEFPFLNPHFIVRASGRREVGPNAVLVSGPNAYKGLSSSKAEMLKKIFERPNSPKWKLFTNTQFLSLVWEEWRSSISKKQMCERVRQFIPSLGVGMLQAGGLAGVRILCYRRSRLCTRGGNPGRYEINSHLELQLPGCYRRASLLCLRREADNPEWLRSEKSSEK